MERRRLDRVVVERPQRAVGEPGVEPLDLCLLYTSDAADERSSVDLGGRRIIKKKKQQHNTLNTDALRQTEEHKTTADNNENDTAKKPSINGQQ
mgnify:CR=1 FL=1